MDPAQGSATARQSAKEFVDVLYGRFTTKRVVTLKDGYLVETDDTYHRGSVAGGILAFGLFLTVGSVMLYFIVGSIGGMIAAGTLAVLGTLLFNALRDKHFQRSFFVSSDGRAYRFYGHRGILGYLRPHRALGRSNGLETVESGDEMRYLEHAVGSVYPGILLLME